MEDFEYCEMGDHDVEEDELVHLGVLTSCTACQEQMHLDLC